MGAVQLLAYFGAGSNIYAIAGAAPTGLLWTYQTGGQVKATPAVTSDGALYVGSYDGY